MKIRRPTIERICMSQQVLFKLELLEDLERFQLPRGVDERLHGLLDRQDRGEELTSMSDGKLRVSLTWPSSFHS
jgi:hypothetical protein